MRLVYMDEAGLSAASQEPFLTVAGIVVHADDGLIPLEKALDALVEKWIPEEHQKDFVFHAKDLFNGGGKVFRRDDPNWKLERRLELAQELAALPILHDLTLSVGVIWKPEHPKLKGVSQREWLAFLHGIAFLSCAVVVESWMRSSCPDEVCMLISEDNDQNRSMIRALLRMNQNPNGNRSFREKYAHLFPMRHIKEDPLFQPKRSSSVLQLADFWAYVAKKHYMKDERYLPFSRLMFMRAAPPVWPIRPIPG